MALRAHSSASHRRHRLVFARSRPARILATIGIAALVSAYGAPLALAASARPAAPWTMRGLDAPVVAFPRFEGGKGPKGGPAGRDRRPRQAPPGNAQRQAPPPADAAPPTAEDPPAGTGSVAAT